MKQKIVIAFSWILVILWMLVIFDFSATVAEGSDTQSEGVTKKTVETSISITNTLGITDTHPSEGRINAKVEDINGVVRKCAHGAVYFILGILIFHALYQSGVKDKKIYLLAILLSFFYACTDEFHQLFVAGRSGEIRDVLIDTLGTSFALLLIYTLYKSFKYYIEK